MRTVTEERVKSKGRPVRSLIQQDPKLFSTPSGLERDATEFERVKEQKGRRLTPEAQSFIIRHLRMGYSNSMINKLLRQYKYLTAKSPDLGPDTFTRIRSLKECQLSDKLLTPEAEMIARASISQLVVDYSNLRVACINALQGLSAGLPGKINDIDTTASELRSILADCTKFLSAFAAKDIQNYMSAVGEDSKSVSHEDSSSLESMERMLEAILMERIMERRKKMEAAGIAVPEVAPMVTVKEKETQDGLDIP